MTKKCDGCGFDDIEFIIVNGQEKDKYCRDCTKEAIADFVLSNANDIISFEIKDKGKSEAKEIILK